MDLEILGEPGGVVTAVTARTAPRTLDPAVSPLANGRIPSLDGMRAVSISLVLFAHLCGTRYFPVSTRFLMNELGDLGNLGVRVFFVISGFLITSLLLEERRKYQGISLRNFYVRRVIRIFPAAYFMILVVVVAGSLGWITLHTYDWLWAMTYTMNYHSRQSSWYVAHLWSLSVEEQFYLLWPAVLALTRTRTALQIVCGVMIAAPVLRYVIPHFFSNLTYLVGYGFLGNADALGAGCLLAGYWSRLSGNSRYLRAQESGVFLLLPVMIFVFNGWYPRESIGFWLTSIDNVAIALCIDWAVRHPRGLIGSMLNARAVAWIGALSYSLYLWQEPFLNRAMIRWFTAFPVNLVLAVGAAAASYYGVERQFQKLRKYFLPGHEAIKQAEARPA